MSTVSTTGGECRFAALLRSRGTPSIPLPVSLRLLLPLLRASALLKLLLMTTGSGSEEVSRRLPALMLLLSPLWWLCW